MSILFTLDEIDLLLSALDTWEATAQREIATRVNKEVTNEAIRITPKNATEEEQQEIVTRLSKRSMAQYTPDVIRRMVRERNESSALIKARLIMMKRGIEQKVTDEVAAELFKREGGDDEPEPTKLQ